MNKGIFLLIMVLFFPFLLFTESLTGKTGTGEAFMDKTYIQKLKQRGKISIQTYYQDGHIVFKRGIARKIYDNTDIVVNDRKQFYIVDGLYRKNFISIESAEKRGFYWSIQNKRIILKKIKKSDLAEQKDATFSIHPAFRDPHVMNMVSLESISCPGNYITCIREELFIMKAEDTDYFRTESSFFMTEPLEIKFTVFEYIWIKPVVTAVLFGVMGIFFILFLLEGSGKYMNCIPVYRIKLFSRDTRVPASGIVFISFFLFLLFLFLHSIIKNAWISDDAYITFRTIDNFINGFGLTWNVNERVQAYTHPLWMFLLSIVYFFTGELYLSTIVISVLISAAAVIIVFKWVSGTNLFSLLGILILCYSKAFIEYSTSGLENPLSYLCLSIFFYIYLKKDWDEKSLFRLSFIAAFGILSRLDTFLLYAPVLFHVFIKTRKWIKGSINVLAGFLPFIAWELFSVFYYGFPFPNTAYAKLNTGIPSGELIRQGLDYFMMALKTDPVTMCVIFLSIPAGFVFRKKRLLFPACGIFLYVLYIIKIGGCFMTGRFFAVPFFCALIILSQIDTKIIKWAYMPAAGMVLLSGFFLLTSIMFTEEYDDQVHYYNNQIANERTYFLHITGLRKRENPLSVIYAESARFGLEMKDKGPAVIVREGIGIEGFYAGPEIHIVDSLALSDALLARLYCIYYEKAPFWTIGHFKREVPEGYVESLKSGINEIKDMNLARYYEKLSLIINGKLFDLNRVIEIIKFNSGVYNSFLTEYNAQIRANR